MKCSRCGGEAKIITQFKETEMNLKPSHSNRFVSMDPADAARHGSIVSRSTARSNIVICSLVAMSILQACSTVGPKLYQASFNDYSDAISRTSDGQMLGNLVRMRYYESPVFLQVASVSTSFSLSVNAGASATINAGAADSYGANVGGSVSETPTITFSMPESGKYYGRLLAPLSSKQVTSLVLAGFDSELVLQTAVRGMNGLKNASTNLDASPEESSAHGRFLEAVALIEKLRSKGIVDLELGGKQTDWSSPVPMNVDALGDLSRVFLLATASNAVANNVEIVAYPDGKWQTHVYEKAMALRFSPDSNNSPDARRLKELLGLKVDHYNFSIVEAEMVNAEKPRGILGLPPGALDPSTIWEEIGMRGRSMLEIMQVAAKEVQVPTRDISRGAASDNQTVDADWLVIKSSDSEPTSHLRISHRGHWFYIDDSDLQSRETFAMLTALFAVVGGTVPGAAPVMTIPVGL
jgi:hypothetical protein